MDALMDVFNRISGNGYEWNFSKNGSASFHLSYNGYEAGEVNLEKREIEIRAGLFVHDEKLSLVMIQGTVVKDLPHITRRLLDRGFKVTLHVI